MSDGLFSHEILKEFGDHAARMREAARARRAAVQLRACVDDKEDGVAVDIKDTLGVRLPSDKYAGCTNLRTLRALLSMIDDRGFERSAHQARLLRAPAQHSAHTHPCAQIKFHSAFERCVSRVVYKKVRRALVRTTCDALTVRVANAGLVNREAGHNAAESVGSLLEYAAAHRAHGA